MAQSPIMLKPYVDAVDGTVSIGFGCLVVGVYLRYDFPLALIIFGLGLLLLGAVAMWRRA